MLTEIKRLQKLAGLLKEEEEEDLAGWDDLGQGNGSFGPLEDDKAYRVSFSTSGEFTLSKIPYDGDVDPLMEKAAEFLLEELNRYGFDYNIKKYAKPIADERPYTENDWRELEREHLYSVLEHGSLWLDGATIEAFIEGDDDERLVFVSPSADSSTLEAYDNVWQQYEAYRDEDGDIDLYNIDDEDEDYDDDSPSNVAYVTLMDSLPQSSERTLTPTNIIAVAQFGATFEEVDDMPLDEQWETFVKPYLQQLLQSNIEFA